MRRARRRLTLEIDDGSEPITGRLGDDEDMYTFSGWLQLAAALEAAFAPPPDDDELNVAVPRRTR